MALLILCFASNLNGFVTIPTVKIPRDLLISATTGAAPVPVPPPIPHVTNTMSEPLIISVNSSLLSSAAFSPTSGCAPAPRPFVSFSPICTTVGALQVFKCWLSVLTQTNSTPIMLSSIIRLTALLPAPPTPTTSIFAEASDSLFLISSKVLPPSHNKFPIAFSPPTRRHLCYKRILLLIVNTTNMIIISHITL